MPHCCGTRDGTPAHGATGTRTGGRLTSALSMTSCLWTMLGGFAFLALAGPALGVPAYVASVALLALCPVSMGVMMATMGRRGGHKHR